MKISSLSNIVTAVVFDNIMTAAMDKRKYFIGGLSSVPEGQFMTTTAGNIAADQQAWLRSSS